MQLEFRAVQRIDIFRAGSYNQKQTSEFISACNCSIRHEHQREGGNGIPLVLVPFFFFTKAAAWKRRSAAMQAAERISLAAEEQGILLSSKSTISLVDHISFALERVEKGTFLPNLMLSETRMLYPKEYAVGQRALELVRQFCGVQLPEDEAGYIALHLVAGAADGALAYDTVKFVKAVKEIICDTYHCTFEEESLETTRLTVHLKFLAARILRHTPWQDAGLESMYAVLLQRDSRNEVCLQRINAYLRQEFDYELDHQEQVYLLIHLTKIVG